MSNPGLDSRATTLAPAVAHRHDLAIAENDTCPKARNTIATSPRKNRQKQVADRATQEIPASQHRIAEDGFEVPADGIDPFASSKKQLLSLNEDWQTVIGQLETKLGELQAMSNDFSNLLSSIDYATLCLDRQFRIKRFTRAARQLLLVSEMDVGQPFCGFAQDFAGEQLLLDAEDVLKRLTPIEREVQDRGGRWYARRTVPYRTEDDRIDGVVVSFFEITTRKRQQESLERLASGLEQTVALRTELLELVVDITSAASLAKTIGEALEFAVNRICHFSGWHAGHVYCRDEGGHELVPTGIWHTADNCDFSRLIEVTSTTRFQAGSRGMIPDVARSGCPRWIEDLHVSEGYVRKGDLEARAAIAFPLFAQGEVQAVLEFYSEQAIARDEKFLEAMQVVGFQLGRVIERSLLEKQLAEVTDAEQLRLGQEMHDSIGQQLSGIGMIATALMEDLKSEDSHHAARMARLVAQIEQANTQAKAITQGIVPVEVDAEGLMAALAELAERTESLYEVKCTFECGLPMLPCDSFVSTQLYRIAQEAVHNAIKHASAEQIVVRLENAGGARVSVGDNGTGITPPHEQSGRGLKIMQHRASLIGAVLTIETPPTGGTVVVVSCKQGAQVHEGHVDNSK